MAKKINTKSATKALYELISGISKKMLLTAWTVLGEYMTMTLPENPLSLVYVESAHGAACIYPKRPPKKSYEREIRS